MEQIVVPSVLDSQVLYFTIFGSMWWREKIGIKGEISLKDF